MSKKYDPLVPEELKKTQQWFAGIITRPMEDDSKIQKKGLKQKSIVEEAKKYITPSPTLAPHERIELYNQQYWWRLLSVMHEVFPLLMRMFGYYQFNQEIAVPYLTCHPPTTWSLNQVGCHMADWINENYQGEDKQLIYDAARVDWALHECFVVKQLPPIALNVNPEDMEALLTKKLFLQPHIHSFEFDYDLFEFRSAFIKEDGDYWIDHDFPALKKGKYRFIVSRTPNNNATWEEVSAGEFFLLSLFKKGISIENACAKLEKTSPEIMDEAMANLQKWFQKWSFKNWLSLEKLDAKSIFI